jgi:Flp pilus assembly protein TadG
MSIRSFIQSFLKSKQGNVAPMFALAIIPVIGLTGAAVDYSRANSIKTALQAALDSTALAMAKSASKLTAADLQQQSTDYFNAVFNRPDAKNVSIVATYTTTGGTQLTLTASGAVDTTFTRVMGVTELGVGSSSTIKWGNDRQRVALVLDTTGSMASAGKIDALKTATAKLLDQLKAAASTDGDVLVSIIPFSKDVNVGSSGNGSATWLQFDDATDKSWDGANGTCSKSGYSPRSVCQAQNACSLSSYTTQSSCTAAGTCSLSSYSTQSSCTAAGTCSLSGNTTQSACTSAGTCSNPDKTGQNSCTSQKACSKSGYGGNNSCTNNGGIWGFGTWTPGTWTSTPGTWTAGVWSPAVWTPNSHSTWNGCVTDRGNATAPGTTAGNDQKVTVPTTGDATTLFYPQQYSLCSHTIMGLSSDWTAMKTLVDELYAAGTTNQPIGLVWGWQSLVGGGPLTAPSKSSNYTYKETIILLSDGMNTQDRWYGNGSTTSTQVDDRMYASSGAGTCKNITDSGVTIYTIQVNTGTGSSKDPESAVLKNCASSGKFVMLTTADQIITTFQQIGTQLSQLRVAK